MYEAAYPVHPTYALSIDRYLNPSQQLVELTPMNQPPTGSEGNDIESVIKADDSINDLLIAGRRGLESLAGDIANLLEERRQEGKEIVAGIDRDKLYLDNLILDRYRHGERPTDDQTYVRLREHQLKLESERRHEQSSLWRDTVLLAKELSELQRRVNEARQRELLFGGGLPDP